jgi:hypothetical protein
MRDSCDPWFRFVTKALHRQHLLIRFRIHPVPLGRNRPTTDPIGPVPSGTLRRWAPSFSGACFGARSRAVLDRMNPAAARRPASPPPRRATLRRRARPRPAARGTRPGQSCFTAAAGIPPIMSAAPATTSAARARARPRPAADCAMARPCRLTRPIQPLSAVIPNAPPTALRTPVRSPQRACRSTARNGNSALGFELLAD